MRRQRKENGHVCKGVAEESMELSIENEIIYVAAYGEQDSHVGEPSTSWL
jgi:hypothetical protein